MNTFAWMLVGPISWTKPKDVFVRLATNTGPEKVYLDEAFSGKSARTKSFVTQDISELKDTERAEILARKLG